MMLYKDHAAADIESAVEQALSANVSSSQAVEHILINKKDHPMHLLCHWTTGKRCHLRMYAYMNRSEVRYECRNESIAE